MAGIVLSEIFVTKLKKNPLNKYIEKIHCCILNIKNNRPDPNLKKLKGNFENLYRYKIDDNFRIIIKKIRLNDETYFLFVDAGTHEIYRRLKTYFAFASFDDNDKNWEDVNWNIEETAELPDATAPSFKIYHFPDYETHNEFNEYLDHSYHKYLWLSDEQNEILKQPLRLKLISGKAGTGKTIILLYEFLQNIRDESLAEHIFLSYSPKVSMIIRNYFNTIYKNQANKTSPFIGTFETYARNVLRYRAKNLEKRLSGKKLIENYELQKKTYALCKNAGIEGGESALGIIQKIIKGNNRKLVYSYDDLIEVFDALHLGQEERNLASSFFKVYQKYRDFLTQNKLYDIYDFYRELGKSDIIAKSDKPQYIYLDEVQDFSPIEMDLILKYSENPKKLVITGDEQQKINVTGFNWKILKQLVEEKTKSESNQIFQLKINYRCTKQINEYGEKYLTKKKNDSFSEGPAPVLCVINEKEKLSSLLRELKEERKIMYICFSMEMRNKLVEIFGKYSLVYHSSDVKGLENETVVLVFPSELKPEYEESRNKMMYMAITRAKRNLIVLDNKQMHLSDTIDQESLPVFLKEISQEVEEDFYMNSLRYAQADSDEAVQELLIMGNYEIVEKKFIDDENLEKLAELYVNYMGKYDEAVSIYFKMQNYEAAGNVYENKANDIERAISIYREHRIWKRLENLYDKLERYEEAGDVCQFHLKNRQEVIKYYKLAGCDLKLAVVHEEMKEYEDAAVLYEKIGLLEKAGEMYELDLNYSNARELYRKGKHWKKYAEISTMLGFFNEAGDIYLNHLNDAEKARVSYKKAKQWNKFIEISLTLSKFEECGDVYLNMLKNYKAAKKMYESAGCHEKHAKACESDEDYSKAAEIYMNCGDYRKAGKILDEKCNDQKQAKKIYLTGECWPEYGRVCEKLGDNKEALKGYERAGLHENAGDIACEKLKDYEKAKQFYKKALKMQKFAMACLLNLDFREAGMIYKKIGDYKSAKESFFRGKLWKEILDLAEEFNNYADKGDILLLKFNDAKAAKSCFYLASEWSKFVDACDALGEFEEAGDVCREKLNDLSRAEYFYSKCKTESGLLKFHLLKCNYKDAGKIFLKNGNLIRAEEMFIEAGDNDSLKKIYREIGDFEKLCDVYEREDDFEEVEKICRKKGMMERYAKMCEKRKKYNEAARVFLINHNLDDVKRLLPLVDEIFRADFMSYINQNEEAFCLYLQAGEILRAVALLKELKKAGSKELEFFFKKLMENVEAINECDLLLILSEVKTFTTINNLKNIQAQITIFIDGVIVSRFDLIRRIMDSKDERLKDVRSNLVELNFREAAKFLMMLGMREEALECLELQPDKTNFEMAEQICENKNDIKNCNIMKRFMASGTEPIKNLKILRMAIFSEMLNYPEKLEMAKRIYAKFKYSEGVARIAMLAESLKKGNLQKMITTEEPHEPHKEEENPKDLENDGAWGKALCIYNKRGDKIDQARMHEKIGKMANMKQALVLYNQLKRTEDSERIERIIDAMNANGKKDQAEIKKIYKFAKKKETTNRLADLEDARNLYLEYDYYEDYERVDQILTKFHSKPHNAISAEMSEKLAEYFEKNQKWGKSLELYKKMKKNDKVMEMHEKIGKVKNLKIARDYYLELGKIEEASRIALKLSKLDNNSNKSIKKDNG